MNYRRITLMLLFGLSAWNLRADSPHIERSSTMVYVKGVKYYVHTVREGDTLYSIARAYGVSEQTLIDENPAAAYGLKIDQNIKIPYLLAAQAASAAAEPQQPMSDKKLRRKFDTHYICAGETLYSIARRYKISVETIMADNPDADPAHLTIGDALRIRKREIGSADDMQNRLEWESYKNNLNSVADAEEGYHIVSSGETVYSLSRRFGISEEEFVRMNNLADGLKAGSIVRVPRRDNGEKRTAPNATVTVCPEEVRDPDIFEPAVSFRPLSPSSTLDVALLLPLSAQGKPNANFMEFYQGFLIGLEDVKTQYGRSVRLTLFDTERDSLRIADIVNKSEFRSADLIIGPVYEEETAQVTAYADRYRIPVVSPLASVESLRSNVLFQMAPDQNTKYDKVRELLDGKHVTLVYGGNTDEDYERDIFRLLSGRNYDRCDYRYVHSSSSAVRNEQNNIFTSILRNGLDNVMIVMADNETDVDRILASIASARLTLSSRGQNVSPFAVLGNSHWNRYNNIDRTIFFEDHVALLSSYNAKRDNAVVKAFDSRYAKAFGSLPSLYSYRGYDAAVIFAEGMYGDIAAHMEGRVYVPLQTPYMFRRQDDTHLRVNSEWALIQYNDDFTITTR